MGGRNLSLYIVKSRKASLDTYDARYESRWRNVSSHLVTMFMPGQKQHGTIDPPPFSVNQSIQDSLPFLLLYYIWQLSSYKELLLHSSWF